MSEKANKVEAVSILDDEDCKSGVKADFDAPGEDANFEAGDRVQMEVPDGEYSNWEIFTVQARGQDANGNWYYRLNDKCDKPYQDNAWVPQKMLTYA